MISLDTHKMIKRLAESRAGNPVAAFVSISKFSSLIEQYVNMVGNPNDPKINSVEITTKYGGINVYPCPQLNEESDILFSIDYIVDSEE